MSEEEIDRKITVIFATDVVGYSKHMEADESGTVKNLRACEKLLTGLFKKHKGRLFNTGGDSFLAEFSSAVSAVECAVEFQKAIEQRNSTEDATVKLKFRIGINSGDVIKEKDNLLGDGVNIAARLEALAQSGGITISKSVYDYVKGKTKFEFNDLGIQKVKQNEFHAFDLLLSPDQKRKITKKSNGYIGYIIVALALLLVGSGLFIYETQKVSKQIPIIASDRPNILILPFNSIGAEEDKYISEGITDTLIGTLLKYEQLKIQPLLTSKFISEQKLSNDKIISDYGVNYIVNGNLQVQSGELRLNIQLTDLMKNDVIWSERFDFELDNLFDIQDQLSEEILNSLSIELTIGTAHQDSRKYFKSVKNWRKLISARADFIQSTPESFQRMGETVAELYEEEPENPMVLVLKGWHQYFSAGNKEGALVAYDLAQEAIKLGPDLADAYMLASFIELNNPFQIVSSDQTKANQMAESRARKAAELDKTSPHNFGAIGNTLSGVGKVEESLSFYKKALVLAYIAHKEGEKKNAAAFIESLNSMALNTDFGSKLESIMWGFWNVKSNKEFIEDFKEAMIQFGVS